MTAVEILNKRNGYLRIQIEFLEEPNLEGLKY